MKLRRRSLEINGQKLPSWFLVALTIQSKIIGENRLTVSVSGAIGLLLTLMLSRNSFLRRKVRHEAMKQIEPDGPRPIRGPKET